MSPYSELIQTDDDNGITFLDFYFFYLENPLPILSPHWFGKTQQEKEDGKMLNGTQCSTA